MISRTTLETMKVICNRKDECKNVKCWHYVPHSLYVQEGIGCAGKECNWATGYVECIQADPIRFELVEG